MAELIWASIEEVVVAAPQVMSWLQKIARLLTKANRPIVWMAPSGFRVEQAYKKLKETRLKIRLFDKTYAPKLTMETASLDPCRQANGISPNFIHSMDAAALVLFVVKAQQAGLRQLAMIHDSYGTLAADVPRTFQLLREAFVSMYRQHDVLDELILSNGLEQQMEPIQGSTLDLEQIKASLFLFD